MPTTVRTRILTVGAVGAFVLAGCGKVSWDDAKKELVSSGATEATADCVIAELQAAGFEAEDFTDDNFDAAGEAALDDASETCLTGEDVTGMLDDDAIRNALVQGFESGGLTTEQAECVFDELMAGGFDPATAINDPNSVSGLMPDAVAACTG